MYTYVIYMLTELLDSIIRLILGYVPNTEHKLTTYINYHINTEWIGP